MAGRFRIGLGPRRLGVGLAPDEHRQSFELIPRTPITLESVRREQVTFWAYDAGPAYVPLAARDYWTLGPRRRGGIRHRGRL
jgi:hypothetical protein